MTPKVLSHWRSGRGLGKASLGLATGAFVRQERHEHTTDGNDADKRSPLYLGRPQTSKEGQLNRHRARLQHAQATFARRLVAARARPLDGFAKSYAKARKGALQWKLRIRRNRIHHWAKTSMFCCGQAAVMAHPLGNATWCLTQRTHSSERSFYAIPSGRFGPAQIYRTATCDWIADNCGIYTGQGSNSAAYATAEYTYGDQDWSTETRR